jgi:hypothetical protein
MTGERIDEALALTLTIADNIQFMNQGKTYHAIHFYHFWVSSYEQTLTPLTRQGQIDDAKDLSWDTRRVSNFLGGLAG